MTTEPPQPPDSGGPTEPPFPPEPPVTPPPGDGQAPFQVGDAFNYGWKKFQEYLGPILIAMVIFLVVGGVVSYIGALLSGGFGGMFMDEGGVPGFTDFFFSFGYLVWILLSTLIYLIIQAGIIRGSLAITKGESVDLNTFFSMDKIGQVILAAVILAIGTSIGFILCFIPGLVVAFFSLFTYYFILDQGLPAWDAIKASFSLVNKNLGSVIGLFLASILAFFIGAILCGIGLLVAVPVIIIATAYAYRRLSGQPVTP